MAKTPTLCSAAINRIKYLALCQYVAVGLFAMALAVGYAGQAHSHDFWINHSGYKGIDGTHCCGKNDCAMVPASDMQSTPDGWLIRSTGETIPYSEAQISEDSDFWRCKRWDGSRRCFFYPPGSS